MRNRPRGTKQLVRREVVRVVSPRTLIDAGDLETKEPAFLMALAWSDSAHGAALVDLTTGEFTAAEYPGADGCQSIADEIAVLRPREVIVSADVDLDERFPEVERAQLRVTKVDAWAFGLDHAGKVLREQLRAASLDGFGLEGHPVATIAAGALVQYLRDTQKVDLEHVRSIAYRSRADHVLIDPATFTHLEVFEGAEGGPAASLLAEIDRSITPMGGRRLASLAPAPVQRARAGARPAGRGRGARLSDHRARQAPGHAQGRARSRTLGGTGSRWAVRVRATSWGSGNRSRRCPARAP